MRNSFLHLLCSMLRYSFIKENVQSCNIKEKTLVTLRAKALFQWPLYVLYLLFITSLFFAVYVLYRYGYYFIVPGVLYSNWNSPPVMFFGFTWSKHSIKLVFPKSRNYCFVISIKLFSWMFGLFQISKRAPGAIKYKYGISKLCWVSANPVWQSTWFQRQRNVDFWSPCRFNVKITLKKQ